MRKTARIRARKYVSGGQSGSNIWRSISGGDTWTTIANTTDSYRFVSFHPRDANVVDAGASSGSYISPDRGVTWTFTPGKTIRAMFPANGDIVYAFEPINSNSSILWRSDHQGTDWTQVTTNPCGANGPQINDVDIDALDSNRLYVAMSGALWVFDETTWMDTSTSGGIATDVFGSTNSKDIKSLAADPSVSGTVYADMGAGGFAQRHEFIYRSTDFGITWQDIRFNLSSMESVAWGLAVDPATSEVHLSSAHENFVLRADTQAIPTVSEWGLVVMTHLALVAGSLVLARRQVTSAPLLLANAVD